MNSRPACSPARATEMKSARLCAALLALVAVVSASAAAADSAASSSSSAQAAQTSKPAPPASGGGSASLLTDAAACLLGVGGIALAYWAKTKADSAKSEVQIVKSSLRQRNNTWQPAQSDNTSPKKGDAPGGDSAARVADLANRVASLERAIAELREGLVDRAKGLAPLGDDLFSPPADEPPPIFPASVDDLRERFGPGAKVAWNPVTNLLHEDASGSAGSVVTIGDNLVLLPARARMGSAADYRAYFEQFFVCGTPSRGTVEIMLPALVEKVGDRRFHLVRHGEIRIQ